MTANGMPSTPDETDDLGYRFYPLERMELLSDHPFHKWQGINGLTASTVVFGDYLQLSWALAIESVDETVVRAVGQLGNPVLAPSFPVFLERYLDDSPELYRAGDGTPAD
jgi:hypothetical protein